MAFVLEHQSKFPGVEVEREFLREYPHGTVGAHLFGQVGEVTEKQLKDQRYNGVELGDRVGQAGIEAEYDRFLRGRNGAARVQVDALGNLTKTLQAHRHAAGQPAAPVGRPRRAARGQQALAGGTGKGAFAVMDVNNGEVLGLGSQPSFDPNIFSKPLSQKRLKRLYSEGRTASRSSTARSRRAIPPGSTFKLITATAALESGHITPDTVLNDPGSLTVGGVKFKNAGGAVHGALALRQALTVSSDVFFYQLGQYMDEKGMPLQKWGHRLGIGRKTGIDLPAEEPGRLPTPQWRDRWYKQGLTDRPWSVGDNINLVGRPGRPAGQPAPDGGGLRRDRQRRARAAAAARAAHRGRLRAGAPAARRADRPPAQDLPGEPRGDPRRPPRRRQRPGRNLDAGVRGLPDPDRRQDRHRRARGQAGPVLVRRAGSVSEPKYVVAVTDEAGGFGAETAAPMARRILAELLDVKETGVVQGGAAPD